MLALLGCGGSGSSGKGTQADTTAALSSTSASDKRASARSGAGDSSEAGSAKASSDLPAGASRSGQRATVLIIGTSLTAGLGLDPEQAYPAVIQRMADSAGFAVQVVNAGLSGETSAGALRRLDWIMRDRADLVVVETGANDGLRGLDPDSTLANLTAIVRGIKRVQPGARIVLVQMEAPPNLGGDYTRRFHDMYGEVAKSEGVGLTPFLLDKVAGVPRLNQADGIHPTAEGAQIVARNIWPSLEPEIRTLARSATAGQ